MKRILCLSLIFLAALSSRAEEVFYYSPEDGTGGLRIAIKDDEGKWKSLGNLDWVISDFGPYGTGKKMWSPMLFPSGDGWNLLFRADEKGEVMGVSSTRDFIRWQPQVFVAASDTASLPFRATSAGMPFVADLDNVKVSGRVIDIDSGILGYLAKEADGRMEKARLFSERCADDGERFASLAPFKLNVRATGKFHLVSKLLTGVFFEDINYAADGGLYGELVQNRDFEYGLSECGVKDWGPGYAWKVEGDKIQFSIETENPISDCNPHYARLAVKGGLPTIVNNGANAFVNSGWDGIPLTKGEPYRLRIKARSPKAMPLEIWLVAAHGRKLASGKLKIEGTGKWNDYELVLTPDEHSSNSTLQIVPKNNGQLDLDMVSLFPVNTFKGRENGLRRDLAQAIADLKPAFVRFPGGCVAHGNGLDNIYDWKGSIGKLEDRKPLFNMWGYHQTRGLGYHEYFQFCEDIGAEPVPVVAAGVCCQFSSVPSKYSRDAITSTGQQGGLPLDSLDSYIADIEHLIEYANGSAETVWGKKRVAAGHPEPFNLKYIALGNEDMISDVFKERFSRIHGILSKKYPDIVFVGTSGPGYEGTDYREGWDFARKQGVGMVDEHYYVEPGWLVYNQEYYDGYDRKGPKVMLGEWASHLPGRNNNVETALSEALYLLSLERNGDVVGMSAYAPLLAKEGHTQWNPNLIYFNNTEVKPTADYEVMRLFGENRASEYFEVEKSASVSDNKAEARTAVSVTKDSVNGEIVMKVVNMLPVETTVEADLSALIPVSKGELQTVRTVLSGNPGDVKAKVKTDRVAVASSKFVLPVPPYSLTLLRFNGK